MPNWAEFESKIVRVGAHIDRADVLNRAAAVSYNTMLASVPLLAVVLTLSAQLLPNLQFANSVGLGDVTTAELNNAFARLLPAEATTIVKAEITRIQSQPPVGWLSLGLLLSLWTSSNAYMASMVAMNEIYGVKETRPWWKVRLIAMTMPLFFAVILLTALGGIIIAPHLIRFFELGAFAEVLMTAVQWSVCFLIVLATFETAYRLGPRQRPHGKRFSVGSVIGATCFVLSSVGFQIYVQTFGSYDRVYGSLGGFIVFLIWMWMSSACLLLGSSINKANDDDIAWQLELAKAAPTPLLSETVAR